VCEVHNCEGFTDKKSSAMADSWKGRVFGKGPGKTRESVVKWGAVSNLSKDRRSQKLPCW